jgi:hypothetical protein
MEKRMIWICSSNRNYQSLKKNRYTYFEALIDLKKSCAWHRSMMSTKALQGQTTVTTDEEKKVVHCQHSAVS